jgi:hypothetical protein
MRAVAWSWLTAGATAVLAAPFMLRALPVEAGLVPLVIVEIVLAGAGVALPALFVWAYRDADLVQTCARRDARTTWIDSTPPRALGLALGLALLAALTLPLMLRPALPVGPWIVTGWPAVLLLVALAAASAWLVGPVLRQESRGWWGAVLLTAGTGVAMLVSAFTMDPAELYQRLGYADTERDILVGAHGIVTAIGVALTAGCIVYLLWIRREFSGAGRGR